MTQLLRAHGEVVWPTVVLLLVFTSVQVGRACPAARAERIRPALVRIGAETVAVGNLLGALAITLVPGRGSGGRSLNLVPFHEVYRVWVDGGFYSAPRDEVLINLGLFVPFALAAGFAWPRLRSFRAALLTVAGIALGIEVLQLVLPIGRAGSVTDVLLPVIGAVPAVGLASVLRSVGLDAAAQPQAALGALVEGGVTEADDVRGRG